MEEIINIEIEDLSKKNESNANIVMNQGTKSINVPPPGIELLMKNTENKPKNTNVKTENVDSLQKELDDLNTNISNVTISEDKKSPFNTQNKPIVSEPVIKINEDVSILGDESKKSQENENANKTWDGFKQFSDIPTEPTKPAPIPTVSKDQLLREKFIYLKRLESLEKRGVKLSQTYNIESNLDEMKGEYEMIKSEKEKSNSVKFQAKMLMAFITGVEFLNNKFDPFDVNLDGWGETVNENINDYDDVFTELHEKYSSKAKILPELKLLFMLGGSAVMCHMTNTMFKSAMPGMDDILKQNPDLMKQFTGAAMNSMQNESSGFTNFMNDLNNNKSTTRGVDIEDVNQNVMQPRNNNRPEMKGPSEDINNLLSGLKKKETNKKQKSINKVFLGDTQKKTNRSNTVQLDI
jgi:hypothetical protein